MNPPGVSYAISKRDFDLCVQRLVRDVLGPSAGCPKKKYTSLKSKIFLLRTDQSVTLVPFVRQVLNLDFDT